MSVNINITCDWCHKTVQGGEGTKVPSSWVKGDSLDPTNVREERMFDYCTEECRKNYANSVDAAHEYAQAEYTKAFYKVMNDKRAK